MRSSIAHYAQIVTFINFRALTVTNCTIANNSAINNTGGIVNVNSGTLNLTDSTIANNSAGNNGGGFLNDSLCTVTSCVIAHNSASYGGGIFAATGHQGTLIVTNCTIANNSATLSSTLSHFSNSICTARSMSEQSSRASSTSLHWLLEAAFPAASCRRSQSMEQDLSEGAAEF